MKSLYPCVALLAALSAWGQVRGDWNSTIAASNPLDWYRFDELSGSAAVDYGSQHLNGTYGTGAEDATRGVPGIVGTAAQFDNQSTVFLHGGDVTGDWTAEFVLTRFGSKQSSVLIRGIPFASPSEALKLEQYNNTEQVGFTQFGVADYLFTPAVPSPLNQWIDLVYVNRAGSGMSLYLNGVLVGTSPHNINLPRDQIGSYADTIPESPLAIMDEAVLYNRALSSGEIAAQYAAISDARGLKGDMNDDGVVNNFDISPFEVALTDPAAYLSAYPSMTESNRVYRGDINNDNVFDNFDILPFETLLTRGHFPAAAVPEPSTFVLLAVGVLGWVCARGHLAMKKN